MRQYFYLLLLLQISNMSFSQDSTKQITPCAESEIPVYTDIDPEFPGGQQALSIYISKNTVYPQSAKERNEQGTVYVEFIVTADGAITNVKVAKGVSPELDQEAIRVISAMPPWEPAIYAGQKVCSHYTIPITYTTR
jgi:protein TonB